MWWRRNPAQPRTPRGYSLRARLTASTVASGMVAGLVSTAIVLTIAWYEVNDAYDDTLKEGARLVLALGEGVLAGRGAAPARSRDAQGAVLQLDYQIIDQHGTVLARGEDAPRQPFVAPGSRDKRYYDVRVGKKNWRVYLRQHKTLGFSVQVGQQWKDRNELVGEVLTMLAWPLVALWLLLGGVNAWLVRRLTAPLAEVARRIEAKSPEDLSPLPEAQPAREIRAVSTALNRLLARLAQALARERRFTADAAHELRTPLAALASRIQLMQRSHAETGNPTLLAELQRVRDDVARSAALAENLLQLAQLDPQSAQNLATESVALAPLLDDVVRVCAASARARNVTVRLECRVASVRCHRDALFSALRNLLDNAIRYGRADGQVQINAQQAGTVVALSVEDDGDGVTEADRDRLTQRFFRVLGSNTPGSGLGLSIAERVAQLHGGRLRFGPGLGGRGLGVTLEIPR